MISWRPALEAIMTRQWWGTFEVVFGLLVFVLSVIQKAHDHSNSAKNAFGFLSYLLLVAKAGIACVMVADGVFVILHASEPVPVAVCIQGVLVGTQLRQLIYQAMLRHAVLGHPVAGPSILHMPLRARE